MELEVLDHLDILVQAENNTQSTEKTRNVSSQVIPQKLLSFFQ